MKLTCTLENFKKAIYNTERVIGKQITLPILENILLETEKGMLKIAATNLEIGVSLKIGAKIEKEGKITVPAKVVSSFVNNLPNDGKISLEEKNQALNIKCEKYQAKIKGLGAQDFPIIPEIEGAFLFSVPAQELKENLPKLLGSVSVDNARLELNGINVILGEKEIILAATDSFRLGEAVISLKSEKNDNYSLFISKTNSIIVPAMTFSEVLRSIAPETEEVKVSVEENQIFFQIDNVRIVSRLINGKYPEYKNIIPQKTATQVFIDKDDLLRAVRIASVFAQSKGGEVKLAIKREEIVVKAESEEKGENETELDAEINGTEQEIIFNPRYVLDGINAMTTPKMGILVNTADSPVIFRMIKGEKQIIEKFTYIVMPIKK
jgi:DNA polymerase III subunit beta